MPSIDLKDQYFGCEIEMTGLTRQQAAEAVASLFGTNAVHSRSSRTFWHQRSTRLSFTFKALNRISSLEYIMERAFFRLCGVCLEAST